MIDMMSRNQAQIKSTSLRLYGPKGSPFPNSEKVWDIEYPFRADVVPIAYIKVVAVNHLSCA